MSAFAMAVLLNGMTTDETVALTKAMLGSGQVMKLNSDLENCFHLTDKNTGAAP